MENFKIVVLSSVLVLSATQLTTTLGNVSVKIVATSTQAVTLDPTSPYHPNDFYRKLEFSTSLIITLESSNLVKVYQKYYPNNLLQSFTDYDFTTIHPYVLVDTNIDQPGSQAVLTSHASGIMKHLVHSLNAAGLGALTGIYGHHLISTQPIKTFLRGSWVYSYFRDSGGSDSIHAVSLADNSSFMVSLGVSNCSVAVSSNSDKMLVWTRNSRVYIYSISGNFSLDYVFNDSRIGPKDKTDQIAFSSDGSLALIQTDNLNPVRVLNLTDFSVALEIIAHGKIYSANFLDADNRFITIDASSGTKVYDQNTSLLGTCGGSLGSTLTSSYSSSELLSFNTSAFSIYGLSVIDGNTSIMNYLANYNLPQKEESPFSQDLQFNQIENKTVDSLNKSLSTINSIVQTSFSIIFSTPLASFFIGLFSYFTILSLYVLVNVKPPTVVFDYLQNIYISCQSDILTYLGLDFKMARMAQERVTDQKALYFSVSSDLFPSNCTPLVVMVSNMILFELFLMIVGRCKKFLKVHQMLNNYRGDIYVGLIVSNMIPLILPWKYSILGGYSDFPSKMTLGSHYLLLNILPFIVIATLLGEIEKCRMQKHRNRMRVALYNWWPIFENLIFPFTVLLASPIPFMVMASVSHFVSMYLSFSAPEWKISAVIKTIYPIAFHICFLVFMNCQDSKILSITSITCLMVLLVGALHHLLETLTVILMSIHKGLKNICSCLKVEPINQEPQIEKKEMSNKKVTIRELSVKKIVPFRSQVKDNDEPPKQRKLVTFCDPDKMVERQIDQPTLQDSLACRIQRTRINKTKFKTTKDGKQQTNNLVIDIKEKGLVFQFNPLQK